MDKISADEHIIEYFQKIYGFAVKKSYSYDETEELAAEMVKEVYMSMLHAGEIVNIEGYIWRICEHTYAKYVNHIKKKKGISIDGMEIPYYDEYELGESEEELKKLRKEIGFLSANRRQIIYSFYYEGKSVQTIAAEQNLSEGTVKWHLNKARNDLKEGFSMERKVGSLGIKPVEAIDFSHNGTPGSCGGPEYYLQDRINLNLVYSVYDSPKTKDEMAEELGMTPVYLEERIGNLLANGFLVETAGKKYTTYVKFTPQRLYLEEGEVILKSQLNAAKLLYEKYVPVVKEAVKKIKDVYIPGDNRELFEETAVFYAITEKCGLDIHKDIAHHWIKTLDGGDYAVSVTLKPEIADPDYRFTIDEVVKDYNSCGAMWRESVKYKNVTGWSNDSRFTSRKGSWKNNLDTDYDAVYEVMTGAIEDNKANEEKYNRLRERGFLREDNSLNVIVVKNTNKEFTDMLPELDEELRSEIAKRALEQATMVAKHYPQQLQDYVVYEFVSRYIGNVVAMMVLDIMQDTGDIKPLSELEKAAANMLVFVK